MFGTSETTIIIITITIVIIIMCVKGVCSLDFIGNLKKLPIFNMETDKNAHSQAGTSYLSWDIKKKDSNEM